jgi:hypothetical protein
VTSTPISATPATPSATPAAPRRGRSRRRTILGSIAAVVLLAVLGGTAYLAVPQPNLPEAQAALASTPVVTFGREDGRLVFRPTAGSPTTGFVFYPGGKVEPAAYAPGAAAIAARGYLVIIVPMPLNLAVLNIDGATAAIAAHPEIRHWAIGGHSLGGAMAAQYLANHPGAAEGLIFWAAYAATSVSGQRLRVLIAYGSLDAGADSYVGEKYLANLPPDPVRLRIEGGNHEQMGWYTGQPNDPPATITRADQQARVTEATAALLASLGD